MSKLRESGFTVAGILAGVVLLIVAVFMFAGVNTWIGVLLVVLAILAFVFL
jgi:hypothetical protein